eukprot:TRINITY_DN4744_c0_g1_i1.p1 TRINITY_DN4744_c0_g1~~TRINITY_DN4744_c0_g1_i1.p1  ORF type:complete len:215 (-),score=67.82 TRINITY_DN4744_c0_g1_i1:13-657(-)
MVSGHLQGRLLKTITAAAGAKRVLELGTFTGYSALCFAEGGAHVVTCELDPRAAAVARDFVERSPYRDQVTIIEGRAMDTLHTLAGAGEPPFDAVFIDNDKRKYQDYYEAILQHGLLAPGGLILADNVLFKGLVPAAWSQSELDSKSDSDSAESGSESESEGVAPAGAEDKQRRRRLRIACALHSYNLHVQGDSRVEVVVLPMRDGISIARLKT